MTMEVGAVFWDIDGTLVDSEPLHHAALLAVCANYGADLSHLTMDVFRGVHLNDVWDEVSYLLPDKLSKTRWQEEIDIHYHDNRHQLVAMPGAREAVSAIAALGVPQACVSNSSRRVVNANIAVLGIAHDIVCSISLDDVENGKPDPEPYLRACAQLASLPAAAIIAVEDSATGIESARAAGLRVAAYGPRTDLPVEAEWAITRLTDIVAIATSCALSAVVTSP